MDYIQSILQEHGLKHDVLYYLIVRSELKHCGCVVSISHMIEYVKSINYHTNYYPDENILKNDIKKCMKEFEKNGIINIVKDSCMDSDYEYNFPDGMKQKIKKAMFNFLSE